MTRVLTIVLTLIFVPLFIAPASSGPVSKAGPPAQSVAAQKNSGLLHKARQCQQRIGPYATQNTAWQYWRVAQGQGYGVSNGVVPCRDQYGSRGYCFFVFYSC